MVLSEDAATLEQKAAEDLKAAQILIGADEELLVPNVSTYSSSSRRR
jgi:hypothetical protein